MQRAVAELGSVDILIANAGRNIRKSFLEIEPREMQEILGVTLWGAFHASQLAARQMVRQGHGGSIVFISSVHAARAFPNSVAYNTAKCGLNHMARTMAAELTPYAIRVNAIEPGWIDTPGERGWVGEEQLLQEGKKLPMGRLGRASEIASGVAYLVSDDASYVTGSILRIDGGFVLPRLH